MARAMARLAGDPAKRESMAGAAANWYGAWPTWSEIGGRVEGVIRDYGDSGAEPAPRPVAQVVAAEGLKSIIDEVRA